MEMNKYQLIDAMVNDLGNENTGLQVRGYRNVKIVTSVLEALVGLKDLLKAEEDARAKEDVPDEN